MRTDRCAGTIQVREPRQGGAESLASANRSPSQQVPGGLAAAIAAAAWALSTGPAWAMSAQDFDWYGLGGCNLPVVGMTVDFAAVAADVPASHAQRLVTLGVGGRRQAVLILVLSRCPTNALSTRAGTVTTRDVIQVMAGLLYDAGRAEDADKVQFYLLSSAIDWEPFSAAERNIGLPSHFTPGLVLVVQREPLSGTGSFRASVPAGPMTLTASGRLFAPNPVREFPLDAAHFHQGPLGLVRVHHDESWAVGNTAEASVTAPAGSRVAGWMGATTRAARDERRRVGLLRVRVERHQGERALHARTQRVIGIRAEPPSSSCSPSARRPSTSARTGSARHDVSRRAKHEQRHERSGPDDGRQRLRAPRGSHARASNASAALPEPAARPRTYGSSGELRILRG